MSQKKQFSFNSALTELPENGQFDEEDFEEKVGVLVSKINTSTDSDGIVSCFFARYGMEVEFIPEIISAEQVLNLVKRVMEEYAPNNGFFPLRGEKMIQVTKS